MLESVVVLLQESPREGGSPGTQGVRLRQLRQEVRQQNRLEQSPQESPRPGIYFQRFLFYLDL